MNIYAPSESHTRKQFFIENKTWIRNRVLNENCLIMCGDLNCSLERIDSKVQNLDASRASFKELITYLKLDDIYRTKNGDKLCYTYANKSNSIQSRIDYILGSAYINGKVKKCYTQNVPKAPDHKAVLVTIKLGTNRGPGYWKLNNKILESVILRDRVNVILDVMLM